MNPLPHVDRRTAVDVRVAAIAVLLAISPAVATTTASQPTETVAELRVHGNQRLADADVFALAGVALGDVVGSEMIQVVEQRLLDSGRFERVEVRKRYRALSATDVVTLIVVVKEHAAPAGGNRVTRAFGEFGRRAMVSADLGLHRRVRRHLRNADQLRGRTRVWHSPVRSCDVGWDETGRARDGHGVRNRCGTSFTGPPVHVPVRAPSLRDRR